MDKRASSGFTIIETMLFLAVSGALLAGVIITIGSTISSQRYRDAADSFKALVQQQYNDVNNTQNGRTNNYTCNSQGQVTEVVNANAGTPRGQSTCVSVGKYMTIRQGVIKIYPVVAYENTAAAQATNDITSLTSNYRLNVTSVGMVEDELRWGTRISFASVRPNAGSGNARDIGTGTRSIALLFVRSPKTGQMYTFSSNTPLSQADLDNGTDSPSRLRNMIVAGENANGGQSARTICIDSTGLLSTGFAGKLALYIPSYASNPGAIELRSNETLAANGMAEQCN